MLELNFGEKHSHKWARDVHTWIEYLSKHNNESGIEDICYERNKLPLDGQETPFTKKGHHFAPLMTALMYSVSMDQKMQIEVNAIKDIFPSFLSESSELEQLIEKDTNAIMELFMHDARVLMKGMNLDNLLSTKNYRALSLSPEELQQALTEKPTAENIDNKIETFVRARLAQEYWTIMGAVTTYHLITRGPGKKIVSDYVKANADPIASRITDRLAQIIELSALKDQKGMTTDHYIDEKKPMGVMLGGAVSSRYFNNCPIYEAYQVVDRELGRQYRVEPAQSAEPVFNKSMDFCEVCKQHGIQSMNLYVPTFFLVNPVDDDPERLSKGKDYCRFSNFMKYSKGAGTQRQIDAKARMKNPPDLVVYGV